MVKNMPKKYYTRIIENELDQMLGIFGAVLIEGPKWCGKTTTAETRAASRLLLMDPSRNFENRLRAETDPALAVSGEVPRLIDEWQEVPKLWDAARFECDNRGGEPGQFDVARSDPADVSVINTASKNERVKTLSLFCSFNRRIHALRHTFHAQAS